MPAANREIAAVFEQIAELLELQGANPFRVRAYRNAALTLSRLGPPVRAMVERGEDLDALPGIGADLADKIVEIVRTGRCAQLEALRREVPGGLNAMLQLPQLGPQRVRALHEALGVRTIAQLHEAARRGRVAGVHGFGPRLQQQILEATAAPEATPRRWPRAHAEREARALLAWLRARPEVQRAEAAGSLRRGKASVGDLDLIVQSDAGAALVDAFVHHSAVREVLSAGATQGRVVLRAGLQVDLRVVDAASFGAAWLYFTGSKAHNIALRRRAQRQGLKLSEYGLFRGRTRLAGRDEAEVYAALGLPWIDPAEREDASAIERREVGAGAALAHAGASR